MELQPLNKNKSRRDLNRNSSFLIILRPASFLDIPLLPHSLLRIEVRLLRLCVLSRPGGGVGAVLRGAVG